MLWGFRYPMECGAGGEDPPTRPRESNPTRGEALIPLPTFRGARPDSYVSLSGSVRPDPTRGFALSEDGHSNSAIDPLIVAWRVRVRLPASDGATIHVSQPLFEYDAVDARDWIESRFFGVAEVELAPVRGWVIPKKADPQPKSAPSREKGVWRSAMFAAFYAVRDFHNAVALNNDAEQIARNYSRMYLRMQEVACTDYDEFAKACAARQLKTPACQSPVHDERLHA